MTNSTNILKWQTDCWESASPVRRQTQQPSALRTLKKFVRTIESVGSCPIDLQNAENMPQHIQKNCGHISVNMRNDPMLRRRDISVRRSTERNIPRGVLHMSSLVMLYAMVVSRNQNIVVPVTGWVLFTDTIRIIASPLRSIGFVRLVITNYTEKSNGVLSKDGRSQSVKRKQIMC